MLVHSANAFNQRLKQQENLHCSGVL